MAEDHLFWFCIAVSSLTIFVFVLKLGDLLWWKPKKIQKHFAKQGIRGPPYKLFVGNIKEIMGLVPKDSLQFMPLSHNIVPRVFSFYHHWKKIYGGTFLVWFGPTPRLTVSDPILIREIFCSKSKFYEKNDSHPLVRQLEGNGLLSLKGEKWAHHRKVLTPAFQTENLKLLIPVIGKAVLDMLEKWSEMSNSGEQEIEVSAWFQNLTENVITRTAFGKSYDDGMAIFDLQAQQMGFAAEALNKVFVPGYRFLPTKKNIQAWKLDKEIKKSLVKLIGHRKENSGAGKFDEFFKDLLGLMIKAGVRRAAETISVQDIVEECKTFFFAGKHTTSNLLTWCTVLLAMNQDWQDLARAEVIQVCGARDIPTIDAIAKLKTMNMIINEVLRLYPPTIATIRCAKADVELGGCKIPKGMELLIPILGMHHDPSLWGPDATKFNPARFANGVSGAAKHPMAFIPFGLGARTCIGQQLALLEAKLVLTIFLQRFTFRLASSYRHAPAVLMLLYPQYGAPITFMRLPTTSTLKI